MTNRTNTWAAVTLLPLLAGCGNVGCTQGSGQVTPLKGFPEASLTISPVTLRMTGPVDKTKGHRRFADAFERDFREKGRESAGTLGLLLEEKGYDKVEVTDANFQFPTEKVAPRKRAAAFGKVVSELGLKTDYALRVELTIHIERSWQEVYLVMADANGSIVWEDSHVRGDRGFGDYPGTKLGRLELACSRLAPVMGLDKLPKKELAEDKKRALREMRAKEPPSRSGLAAMEKRLVAMKKAGAAARVLVHPARVGGDHTAPTCATRLSKLLNEARLCRSTVAETGPVMGGTGWPNEMHVLWLFARAVREHVRQHPADSDYVVFADYWVRPHDKAVHAVHFVVCDQAGDWVIVDLQNSHQKDFQRLKPKTLADCDRLVLERLKRELR